MCPVKIIPLFNKVFFKPCADHCNNVCIKHDFQGCKSLGSMQTYSLWTVSTKVCNQPLFSYLVHFNDCKMQKLLKR